VRYSVGYGPGAVLTSVWRLEPATRPEASRRIDRNEEWLDAENSLFDHQWPLVELGCK